jgi:hypothetical protein
MNARFMRGPAATLIPCGSLTLALCLASCLFQEGGGSDTETLTGSVSTPAGAPAARIRVKLIPADYDPSHPDDALIRRALTDDAGRFRFGKLEKGKAYNVIAGSAAANAWAYASSALPGAEMEALSLTRAKVFLFNLHSENYQQADSGIAYFPGTDILAQCDGVSVATVDSVPAGALRFVVESRAGWAHDTTLASASVIDTANVVATRTDVILYP